MRKNILALMTLITFGGISYAGGDIESVEEANVPSWFVYVAGGGSSYDVSSKLTAPDTFAQGTLDESATLFEAGLGYYFTPNIFTTATYQRSTLDIVHVNNYFVSINYQFSDIFLKPYIGLLAGLSQLEWDEAPYTLLPDEKFDSEFAMYGVQAGVEYDFTENWSLIGKYQYVAHDHHMDILRGRNTIAHNSAQNFLLGVRYAF
jgi:opacity protein-like surface antigen